ncbi:hypothetical protein T459_11459 [Capsicum annuum]|uniref:Protein kinase domain-containing protein n=1 Tax=Capsicum annuum TaxID=4072 RepID=A0A2G2ZLZ5_CAPAN|nr:hypothetical protein T459_11459 [Capsicum annuum]
MIIDMAFALEYLHHGCALPMVQCDLKPSNVLLDEDMVAHLSNFGISKLLEYEGDLYTTTLATLGYIAPRMSLSFSDYSFHFSPPRKRNPNDFEGDVSLKQWVSYSVAEAVMDVVDPNFLTSTGNHLRKELDVVASIMYKGTPRPSWFGMLVTARELAWVMTNLVLEHGSWSLGVYKIPSSIVLFMRV